MSLSPLELKLIQQQKAARSFEEWSVVHEKLVQVRSSKENANCEGSASNPSDEKAPEQISSLQTLLNTTNKLRAARESGDVRTLQYELPAIVKRNYLNINDIILANRESHAAFVSSSSSSVNHCLEMCKEAVRDFTNELCACIEFISSTPTHLAPSGSSSTSLTTTLDGAESPLGSVASDELKAELLSKLSRNLGHSTLCLSGGGAITMYHMGIVKTLIESGLYENIPVISGTSGGSIVSGMCATMTPEELLEHCCIDTVSTDFRKDGSMRRQRVAWFPPLITQALHFVRTGYLVDNREFLRCCEFYWGDISFEGQSTT